LFSLFNILNVFHGNICVVYPSKVGELN